MKKIKILVLTMVCALALAGCGDSGTDVTVDTQTDNAQVETTETTEVQEETISEIGKRSNPVPLGQTATFDSEFYTDGADAIPVNLSITLSNVVRGQEALDYLMNANQFNEAAPDGHEWVIFDANLKVNSGSQDEPYYEMGLFTPISSNGEEIQQASYGTFSDGEEFGGVDLYEGGTATGKVAIHVPVGDDALVEYTGMSFDTKVFFALK